jgi:SNF2 family DNA or RNA helicase
MRQKIICNFDTMSEISLEGTSLTVRLDQEHNSRSIQNFLGRKGFRFRDLVWTSNNTNAQVIISIQNYIQRKSGILNLDKDVQKIVQEFQAVRQRFENMVEEAREIKDKPDNNFGDLPIQEFGKNSTTNETFELKPFQKKSVSHALALKNSANFSVPGAGKTWMAYATYFLAKERQELPNVNKLLVVCPLPAFQVWEGEYKTITKNNPSEYTPENNIFRIDGNTDVTIIPDLPDTFEIILINYDKIYYPNYLAALQLMLQNHDFFMILDESHKIKNPISKTGDAITDLAHLAKRRLILTGTPMPNFHIDLWNQFEFLFPNEKLLGSYEDYKNKIRNNREEQHRIAQLLYPFFTRVTDNQLNLPGTNPVILDCPMKPEQQDIYDTISQNILINEENRRRINAYEKWENNITYLIMAATDPGLFSTDHRYIDNLIDLGGVDLENKITEYTNGEHSGKVDALREFLRTGVNLEQDKIIIWCNYRGTLTKIQDMIQQVFDIPVRKIDGSPDLSIDDKEKSLREFRGEPGETNVNILIANPASLAESVSLHQVCHHAIYVDRTFNATHWMQSKKRIHRVGMDDVETRYTILKTTYANSNDQTIDERIRRRLKDKEDRMREFLNDPDLNSNEMELRYDDDEMENGANAEDYAGVLESIRERITNNAVTQNNDTNN